MLCCEKSLQNSLHNIIHYCNILSKDIHGNKENLYDNNIGDFWLMIVQLFIFSLYPFPNCVAVLQ